jgi:hypothetical protein
LNKSEQVSSRSLTGFIRNGMTRHDFRDRGSEIRKMTGGGHCDASANAIRSHPFESRKHLRSCFPQRSDPNPYTRSNHSVANTNFIRRRPLNEASQRIARINRG